MEKNFANIDAYIAKAKPFAQPILEHLRSLVHQANPDVKETIKWGMPYFEYKGLLCGMASFKEHVAFGFWRSELLNDPKGYLQGTRSQGGEAMGNMGRITRLEDLPPDKVIMDFVRQASKLHDDGIKVPKAPAAANKELDVPDYFMKALKRNKQAFASFENFSHSKKKDYVQWITEAKTEKTRESRIATAVEWISEGKGRNWKYERPAKNAEL
jgi:uncharacterized protein YdeI (YjbR/CyaY-like superfamily)